MNKGDTAKYTPRGLRQKQIRRRRTLVAAAVTCALLIGLFAALQLDVWRIRIIEVDGTERVSAEKVYDMAGLRDGDHMLFVSTAEAKRRVMEIPVIRDAKVIRKVPNKIKIIVEERKPFAYVVFKNKYYLIDEDIVLLQAPDVKPRQRLLLIRANALNTRVHVGQILRFPHATRFKEICAATSDSIGNRAKMIVFGEKGVKIFLKEGLYVMIGNGEKAAEKLSLIPMLLENAGDLKGQIAGVNIRYLDTPSFIMKAETTPGGAAK